VARFPSRATLPIQIQLTQADHDEKSCTSSLATFYRRFVRRRQVRYVTVVARPDGKPVS